MGLRNAQQCASSCTEVVVCGHIFLQAGKHFSTPFSMAGHIQHRTQGWLTSRCPASISMAVGGRVCWRGTADSPQVVQLYKRHSVCCRTGRNMHTARYDVGPPQAAALFASGCSNCSALHAAIGTSHAAVGMQQTACSTSWMVVKLGTVLRLPRPCCSSATPSRGQQWLSALWQHHCRLCCSLIPLMLS